MLITWWRYILVQLRGFPQLFWYFSLACVVGVWRGTEGEIRACEITGGERELPRALACPHSLFPFPCMTGALRGKGRGNSSVRDHGGRKGTPAFFRVPAFPFPFILSSGLFFWISYFFFRMPLTCLRTFLAESPTRMPSLQARDSKTSLIERTTTTSLR